VDRRGCVDRAALDAPGAEQPEHLLGPTYEERALRWHAHRDRLRRRPELPACTERLGVRRRLTAGEGVADRGRTAHGPVGVDDDAGGAPAAEADHADGAGGVE